jgi:hypothetical protein
MKYPVIENFSTMYYESTLSTGFFYFKMEKGIEAKALAPNLISSALGR